MEPGEPFGRAGPRRPCFRSDEFDRDATAYPHFLKTDAVPHHTGIGRRAECHLLLIDLGFTRKSDDHFFQRIAEPDVGIAPKGRNALDLVELVTAPRMFDHNPTGPGRSMLRFQPFNKDVVASAGGNPHRLQVSPERGHPELPATTPVAVDELNEVFHGVGPHPAIRRVPEPVVEVLPYPVGKVPSIHSQGFEVALNRRGRPLHPVRLPHEDFTTIEKPRVRSRHIGFPVGLIRVFDKRDGPRPGSHRLKTSRDVLVEPSVNRRTNESPSRAVNSKVRDGDDIPGDRDDLDNLGFGRCRFVFNTGIDVGRVPVRDGIRHLVGHDLNRVLGGDIDTRPEIVPGPEGLRREGHGNPIDPQLRTVVMPEGEHEAFVRRTYREREPNPNRHACAGGNKGPFFRGRPETFPEAANVDAPCRVIIPGSGIVRHAPRSLHLVFPETIHGG